MNYTPEIRATIPSGLERPTPIKPLEQGRTLGRLQSGEQLASMFPKTYGQDRDDSGTQRLARTDARAGFDSPLLRRRVAGRESQERQTGLLNQRQGHEIDLANINQQGAVDAARAGVKDGGITVNKLKNVYGEDDSQERTETRNAQGVRLHDDGSEYTAGETSMSNLGDLAGTMQQRTILGGYKGNNKTGAAADAKVDRAITIAVRDNAPGLKLTSQMREAFREGLRAGEAPEDIIAELQEAAGQNL